jgi:tRNA dimethylallyltransferase
MNSRGPLTNRRDKPDIVVICGPTGIGKTGVSISLAVQLSAEIVGADSMQIYRHMDIGTAKPTPDEMAAVPHHMVNIVEPDEPFDAAGYSKKTRQVILALADRGVLPLVVGGTGLYIKALVHGIFETAPVDPAIRDRLRKLAQTHGIGFLYRRLKECDAKTAERLHPNDTYRILRALEVQELTGEPVSSQHQAHGFRDNPFRVLKIGLDIPRETLYQQIDQRVDAMIDAGLLGEAEDLLKRGFAPDLKSMRSIGYRHMVDHLLGRMPWDETVRTLKRDTRRYAKRQLTWFRSDGEVVWIDPRRIEDILRKINDFLG